MRLLGLGFGGVATFGPAGRMPSFHDFWEGVARSSTSKATTTEELPPSLVARMCVACPVPAIGVCGVG